ncbi:MAG: CvpA family protein [Campylobacterota bacterium]|nr:CvpA family protein [Campylobacterota bacterium]
MENINIFDFIVLSLTALLGLKGLFRGFTKEFFGLIGIVGGVFVASRAALDAGNIVNSFIPISNNNTLLLVGFVLSFVIFWIGTYFAGSVVSKIFSLSGFGIADRILGFAFGATKIFLLFAIISYAVSNVKVINDNLKPKLKDSILFPMLVESGGYIIKLDANNIQGKVSKELESVIKTAKETVKETAKKVIEKETEVQTKQRVEEIKKVVEEKALESK